MFYSSIKYGLWGGIIFIAALPQAYAAIPGSQFGHEPDVTFWLGCGLIAIGLLHRKRNQR